MRSIIILFTLLFFSNSWSQDFIVPPPESIYDTRDKYFLELLRLALTKTEKEYGKKTIYTLSTVLSQGRSVLEIKEGTNLITIHHMGTSKELEKQLLPIRIPLAMGTLSYRLFIIHKDMSPQFSEVKNLSQLKKFVACQASHWADSDILENAGIKVLRTPVYESLFKLVEAKRCDFFPRAIQEVVREVHNRKKRYPNLMIEKTLILKYTIPMYFFVNKKNSAMAKRIEKGLRLALHDGSFQKVLKNHPTTSHLYPLSQWDKRVIIEIPNTTLPKETPLHEKQLWIKLK